MRNSIEIKGILLFDQLESLVDFIKDKINEWLIKMKKRLSITKQWLVFSKLVVD